MAVAVGNAHNEFLSPLAESGLAGGITFFLLILMIFTTAYNSYNDRKKLTKKHQAILLFTTLGLVAYFVHGTLNNFLDADKASVPVWLCAAIIVAVDLLQKNGYNNEVEQS